MKHELIQIISLFLLGLVCFVQIGIVLFGFDSVGLGPLAMVAVLLFSGMLSECVAFQGAKRIRVAKRNRAPGLQ
jgi:hypothetical protein